MQQLTEFLRNVRIHQTDAVRLLDDVPREFAGLIVVLGLRNDLVARELLGQFLDLFLLVGQLNAESARTDGGGGQSTTAHCGDGL